MTNVNFAIETITPRKAEELLARNTRNRNKKPIKIARYARDMAAGNWRLTGEALKFAGDGTLLDGQNRLYAIIESGASIQTAVARGIAPDAQDVMDTATPRSGADQLVINGHSNGKDLQAAYNAHHGYHSGLLRAANSDLGGTGRLTNAEIMAYAEKFPEVGDSLADAVRYKRYFTGFPIGAVALALHEFAKIDADDAYAYFDRYATMDFTGRGEALKALKRRTDRDAIERRSRYKLGTALYMLFRTWNAYRADEPLQKLQIGSPDKGWAAIPSPR